MTPFSFPMNRPSCAPSTSKGANSPPGVAGGGDVITQRTLLGAEALATLPLVFLLRLGLGAVSYAAGNDSERKSGLESA